MTKEFGLRPWDVPRLSPAELNRYLEALEEMAEEARRALQQASRRR